MIPVDTLIVSRGPWVPFAEGAKGPLTRPAAEASGVKENLAAAVSGGRIVETGHRGAMLSRFRAARTVDLGRRLVVPGFVDAHTHPVFAGWRPAEFHARNAGRSYMDIAREGGGIRASVRALRGADDDALVARLGEVCDRFLRHGTTTIEAKSGYGLSVEDELRSLRVLRRVAARHPLDIVPTLLGAHDIPEEYATRRDDYVRLVIEEMIPRAAAEGLAEFADVFCEEGVFTVAESRAILEAARRHGLRLRIHADEIRGTGGAELAAEMGAVTADHLVHASDEGVRRMAARGVLPVLLPGTAIFLRLDGRAPAGRFREAGVPLVLATDFNPGSCPTQSLPLIMTLGCLDFGLGALEALAAVTANAAFAVGRGGTKGCLAPGADADLVALDLESPELLPYRFGDNFVSAVVKRGRLLFDTCEVGRHRTPTAPHLPLREGRGAPPPIA